LLDLGGSRATAVEMAGLLVGSDQVLPVTGTAAGDLARRFNQSVAAGAEHENMNRRLALAAPTLGTGLYTTSIEQVAYAGLASEPAPTVEALARRLWQAIAARGEKLVHEGKPIEGEAASLAMLREKFALILETKGALWRGLGMI
jgi:hypothetical protein